MISTMRLVAQVVLAVACGNLGAAEVIRPPGPSSAAEQLIPIHFTLKTPGFVTLVIEDAQGKRVRNLISETPFPAGENVAEWDGLDDLGRDTDAAKHAVYHIPGRMVVPGHYQVRGLVRPALRLLYEMTPYNPGNPPWRTGSKSSEWLANHTAPSTVLFLPAGTAPAREPMVDKQDWNQTQLATPMEKIPPYTGGQILVGSHVSEGGSGLAWLDTQGRKLHGQMWLGGVWTAASHLARDTGKNPVPGVYAYAAAYWRGDKYNNNLEELRLHELVNDRIKAPQDKRFGTGEDRLVLTPTYKFPEGKRSSDNINAAEANETGLTGLTVRDGLIVASLGKLNRLLFIDGHAHRVIGSVPLENPRGVWFDSQGRLLALSGTKLLRFDPVHFKAPAEAGAAESTLSLSKAEVVLAKGLEEPQQLTLDQAGNIYISDWGHHHQVKVFSSTGRFVRTIGTSGVPIAGPYDPARMNHPNGLSVDDQGRLWVAETDKNPKRISLWNTVSGKLINAFYGPAKYGGGGSLDPADKSRFFYTDEGGGLEFKLDWKSCTDQPVAITYRPGGDVPPFRAKYVGQGPETAFHVGGRMYLTDCYASSPTEGTRTANVWLYEHGVARSVAAVGSTKGANNQCYPIFKTDAFRAILPAGVKLDDERRHLLFAWSDRNEDGQMQPEETTFFQPLRESVKGQTLVDGVTVQRDLSVAIALVGDQALRLAPQGFTSHGVPLYDASKPQVLAEHAQRKVSSGHGQALVGQDGWTVLTTPPFPLAQQGVGGVKNGVPMWSYPSLWPGLHASHIAPMPDQPGMLIGTTRLLGPIFSARGSDLGELWAINGNKGTLYIFTTDGLFVATLFQDARTGKPWPAEAKRGVDLSEVSLHEEDFSPTITQMEDGEILMQVGFTGNLVRLEGLNQARRLPDRTFEVTAVQLEAARTCVTQRESRRQREKGPSELNVRILAPANAPKVDGKIEDWSDAQWITINERKQQVGNWGRRDVKTEAALSLAGDSLYAVYKTDDPKLLNNSGEALQNLFKTGGCLDLMMGANPAANPQRKSAGAGDVRLLVTLVQGRTTAMLYRPVSPGRTHDPVEFTSPVRSLRFDQVENVSTEVRLASTVEKDEKTGIFTVIFEFSVPLRTLGSQPATGQAIRGDLGILRGNGFQTMQRVYWCNKATGLVSDLPSEAELTPHLWGTWKFVSP